MPGTPPDGMMTTAPMTAVSGSSGPSGPAGMSGTPSALTSPSATKWSPHPDNHTLGGAVPSADPAGGGTMLPAATPAGAESGLPAGTGGSARP
jgi:hypothetical protein